MKEKIVLEDSYRFLSLFMVKMFFFCANQIEILNDKATIWYKKCKINFISLI